MSPAIMKLRHVTFTLLVIATLHATSTAHLFSKRKVLISSLHFENCGTRFDPVQFVDVRLGTTDEGDLTVSGIFDAYERIEAPVSAFVKMQRRVLGMWVTVPFCYRRFGTCEFEDVCRYGRSEAMCPPLLEEHDVPCECPIEKGRYNLPGAQFPVKGTRWAGLLAGDYRGTVHLVHGGRQVACYNASFRLD